MTGMAGTDVSPQKDIAYPQDIKLFAVEKHMLPKISCIFMLCVEYNRHHSYLRRIVLFSGVRYNGRHR